LISCSKKEEQKPESPLTVDSLMFNKIDPYKFSDSILTRNILFVYRDDSTKTFNGIFEDENYGIGFFIITPLDTNKIAFTSELLDGIGDGSEIDTITLMDNQKFLYYNSGSAFIGSRNLEVYQYLFSPENRTLYKSYYSLNEDGSVNVVYSKNLNDKNQKDIINFFKNKIELKFIDDLSTRRIKIKYE
jgi:hypothetical protein